MVVSPEKVSSEPSTKRTGSRKRSCPADLADSQGLGSSKKD